MPSEQIVVFQPPNAPQGRPGCRLAALLRGGRWLLWLVFTPWIFILGLDLLVALLVLVVGGLVFVVVGDSTIVDELWAIEQALAVTPLFLLAWLLGAYVSIVLHESGHLLAGGLVGYTFFRCHMGPLKITCNRYGLHVGFSKRTLFGGAALSCPTDNHRLRPRDFLFGLGGPLANLLTAAPLWWLAHRLGSGDLLALISETGGSPDVTFSAIGWGTLARTTVSAIFADAAIMSLLAGLLNLVPLRLGGQTSDGMRLLWNLQGGQRLEFLLTFSLLTGQNLSGIRAREWPEALVQKLLALAGNTSEQCLAAIYAYYRSLDMGEIERAGLFLDAALACSGPPFQPQSALALEAAYFEAHHRANGTLARAWLGHQKPDEFTPLLAPRAEAAILLLEGQPASARARAYQGLAALEELAPKTISALDQEEADLWALLAEAEQA